MKMLPANDSTSLRTNKIKYGQINNLGTIFPFFPNHFKKGPDSIRAAIETKVLRSR